MTEIKTLVGYLSKGRSQRYISTKTGMSRNTVAAYMKRLSASGLSWQQLCALSVTELAVYAVSEIEVAAANDRYKRLSEQFSYFQQELARTGVTLQLLWQEYLNKDPDGYHYSQFCAHFAEYSRRKSVTMHLEDVHFCRFEIDFAGPQVEVLNELTGELVKYPLLVGGFRGSSYSFAEVLPNRQTGTILGALSRWFTGMGGVPEELVTDNLRQMVTRPDRYEPAFTEAAQQFAAHYGCELEAARVRKPRDKPAVESGVYQCALKLQAPLRNQVFRSLEEVNAAYQEQLKVLNESPMQRKGVSRSQQFEAMEAGKLLPLPQHPFSLRHHRQLKAGKNYHVAFGRQGQFHHYSVPFRLTGKIMDVYYDDRTVWIYHGGQCVATHPRKYTCSYSTHQEHMPPQHQQLKRGWTSDYFLQQAEAIGPQLRRYVEKTLQSRRHPQQSFKACQGILKLSREYEPEKLEKAVEALLKQGNAGSKALKNTLQRLDYLDREPKIEPCLPRQHANIRGKEDLFTSLQHP